MVQSRSAAGNHTGSLELEGLRASSLPLFSIVITCFNKVQFIGHAIESALLQDHDSFEVVVVDDGSVDGSWEVIQEYAKSNRRCLAARHSRGQNLGEGATRRYGLELSRGHYILYLDGDDRLLAGRLKHDEEVVRRIGQCSAIISRTRYFHQDIDSGTSILASEREKDDKIAPITNHLYERLELFAECFYDVKQQEPRIKNSPCVGAVTIRRPIALDIPWQREFSCAADLCHFAELFTYDKIFYSDDVLSEYRLTVDGAWFQSRLNKTEKFWQHLTNRHIRFLALRVGQGELLEAQSRLDSLIDEERKEFSIAKTNLSELVNSIPIAPVCDSWGMRVANRWIDFM